ncbi:white collar 2 type of transcription factor [Balamuthia mandrillaris]
MVKASQVLEGAHSAMMNGLSQEDHLRMIETAGEMENLIVAKRNTPVCQECGTTETPEWRNGARGPRTLCNACGLRYAKKVREAKRRKKKKKTRESVSNTTAASPVEGSGATQPTQQHEDMVIAGRTRKRRGRGRRKSSFSKSKGKDIAEDEGEGEEVEEEEEGDEDHNDEQTSQDDELKRRQFEVLRQRVEPCAITDEEEEEPCERTEQRSVQTTNNNSSKGAIDFLLN